MKKIGIFLIAIFGFFSLGGCTKPVKPEEANIISLTASSTLKDKNDKYKAANLMDKAEGRAWCEGKDDGGIGESITIKFDKKAQVTEFYIKNGYGDLNYWLLNNRVAKIQVAEMLVSLKDQIASQKIILPNAHVGEEIKFVIKEIYPGKKYKDTCLEKLSFTEIKESNPVILGQLPEIAGQTFGNDALHDWNLIFNSDGTCSQNPITDRESITWCIWYKINERKDFKIHYNPPLDGQKTRTYRFMPVEMKGYYEMQPDRICDMSKPDEMYEHCLKKK